MMRMPKLWNLESVLKRVACNLQICICSPLPSCQLQLQWLQLEVRQQCHACVQNLTCVCTLRKHAPTCVVSLHGLIWGSMCIQTGVPLNHSVAGTIVL